MGWLSHALGRATGGGPRLNLSGDSRPFSAPIPSGRAPQQPRSLLERVEVNDTFDDLSGSAVGLFGTFGQLPARIYESPVSLVDTAVQRATGASPMQALSGTPIGKVGGAIGKGIMDVGNFVPSLINSHDAKVWQAIGDLPDWTEITDALVEQRLGVGGLEGFAKDFGERTGGVPILGGIFGLGTRAKTVGEFREELAKRGFFANTETGEGTDPTQLARDLRDGRRKTTDFGMSAINDNALVDMAGRLALDPTNALFLVPGANLARGAAMVGRLGSKIMPAARLAEAGVIAGKAAPVAAKSAEAIAQGNRAGATLKGLGRFLRGYRTLSIGTAVGTFGVNRLSGLANDATGDSIPFLREVEEFTTAVESNQPMSNNAAFMLFSAATFPYNSTVIRPVRTAAGKLRAITVGVDDMAPFSQAFGGRESLLTNIGGPDSLRDLHGFLLVQEARARHGLTPAEQAHITSIPSLALRRKFEQQALERAGARMWANGEVKADALFARFRQWAEEQAGVVSKDRHGNVRDQGVRVEFDPHRAGRTWRTFRQEIRPRFKELLDETGEIIWGERDDVVFVEQIALGRSVFRTAAYGDSAAKRVPRQVVLDFLEDNPNVNALDKYGFWSRIIAKDGDPLLKDIENKLNGQRRGAVKTDDYFADARTWEQAAPADPAVPDGPVRSETRAARIDRLRREQAETVDANGTVLPDRVADHQRIQRDLEDSLAAAKDVRWARDKSVDPEGRRAISEALEQERLAPTFVHPGLRSADPAIIDRVVALETDLRAAGLHTKYRAKVLPKDGALAAIPERPIDVAIRQHTAVGEWLYERSPFSPVAKMLHTLTRSVGRDELARGQKQALMNEMIGQGFTPDQVNAVLAALHERVAEQGSVLMSKMFRDAGSLLPGEVNAIAQRVLTKGATPAVAAKAIRSLDSLNGGMYGALSRASSRYWRSVHAKAKTGDKGAKALEDIYRVWNDAPVVSGLATTQRAVAKTFYPIFRFVLDVRWQLLNQVEGGILAVAKDGYMRAYTKAEQASPAARRFLSRTDPSEMGSLMPDVGRTLTNENLPLIALKSFDKRSAKSIVKVIDELGETDPALVALRRNMTREADMLDVQASRLDDAAEVAVLRDRAKRLREQGTGSMAEHLNDTLYRFEKDGPEAATKSEFAKFLDADEIEAMRPLIDRVAEINRQTWSDVQGMLHGNPSRSTLERIANSYWLYWPLSYQIKATKWLADIMLNGSFGHNNGALLAGRYALWQEQHNDRMKNNPAYAGLYEANPNLWFAAQMILPMAPEDIGISLGKAVSLGGRIGQDFANEWLGTDIGLFTTETQLHEAPTWLTKMGPIYSAELMQRLSREAESEGFFGREGQ